MKTILLAPYLWDVYLCFKKVGVTSAFLVKHGGYNKKVEGKKITTL